MKNYKMKYKTYLIIGFLISIGIVIFVNLISSDLFFRADFTDEKLFTLTDTTKKIAGSMNDIIKVEAYFTEDLPPALATVRTDVEDFLKEFRAYSKNKLNFKFIDPKDDKELHQKLKSWGLPALQINIRTEDEMKVKVGFLGLIIRYHGKKQIIPVVQNISNFEYDFDVAVKKLIQAKIPKVAFCYQSEDDSYNQYNNPYSTVIKELKKQYDYMDYKFDSGKTKIPDEVTTLILVAPKDLKEMDLLVLDQFMMRGGNVLFLVNSVESQKGTLNFKSINSGLENYLKNYGIILEKNIIAEMTPNLRQTAGFNSGYMRFFVPYPYFIKTINNFMDKENPVVSGVDLVSFPWTSSINIETKSDTPEFKLVRLIKTSPNAVEQKGYFNVNPQQTPKVKKTDLKQFDLSIFVSGKIKSYFSDRKIPTYTEGDTNTNQKINEQYKNFLKKSLGTHFIVVGDADFCSDQYVGNFGKGNLDFVMNSIEYLTSGEDLINIRSRGNVNRTFDTSELSSTKKTILKLFNIAFMPLLLILFGMFKYFVRRKINSL